MPSIQPQQQSLLHQSLLHQSPQQQSLLHQSLLLPQLPLQSLLAPTQSLLPQPPQQSLLAPWPAQPAAAVADPVALGEQPPQIQVAPIADADAHGAEKRVVLKAIQMKEFRVDPYPAKPATYEGPWPRVSNDNEEDDDQKDQESAEGGDGEGAALEQAGGEGTFRPLQALQALMQFQNGGDEAAVGEGRGAGQGRGPGS